MASEDEKPIPRRQVFVWDIPKPTDQERKDYHLRLADQRGIIEKSDPARLVVLLALWEHELPQDDPLGDTLLPLVGASVRKLKEETLEFSYQTKTGIVGVHIMSQLQERDRPDVMQRVQPLPAGSKSVFEMTVPELRWQVVNRRIPLGGWEMQWRGPLIAHLLIADALAEESFSADAYRILLPEVLDIVAINHWSMRACAERRKIQSASDEMSREKLARLIVRDMRDKSALPRNTDKPVQARGPVIPSRSDRLLAGAPIVVPPKRKLPWNEEHSKKVARYVIFDTDEDQPRSDIPTVVPPKRQLSFAKSSSNKVSKYAIIDTDEDQPRSDVPTAVPSRQILLRGRDIAHPRQELEQSETTPTPATSLVPVRSDQNLPAATPADDPEELPRAKRRTLPWKTDITPPQPKEEPREGVFSWTPSQLWEELDNRGIPHLVDGKKTREKARLVARLLLDDEGVYPGMPMYDNILVILEQNLGRRYLDLKAWALRKYFISSFGLPYDNREPLARRTVQKILEKLGEQETGRK